MELSKLSSKGQVVIPQDLRKKLGLKPGDPVQIDILNDLIIIKKVNLKPISKELNSLLKKNKTSKGDNNGR